MVNDGLGKPRYIQKFQAKQDSTLPADPKKSQMRFAIDGYRIASSETATKLGFKDNDIIETVLEQKDGSGINVAEADQAPPTSITDMVSFSEDQGKRRSPGPCYSEHGPASYMS